MSISVKSTKNYVTLSLSAGKVEVIDRSIVGCMIGCFFLFLLVFQVSVVLVRFDLRAQFSLSLVILFLSVIVCDPRNRSTARLLIRFDPLVRP